MAPTRPDRRRSQIGATSVEYALMIAGICLVLIAGIDLLGSELKGFYDELTRIVQGQ